METFKNQVLNISEGKLNAEQLVSILILCIGELNIDTVSEMARKESKTPRGIKTSNRYKKIQIGKQTFAIKGLEQNNLPF